MGIAEVFSQVSCEYKNSGKCLEAARDFVKVVGADFERSLIIVSRSSRDEKFLIDSWPFHTTVIGYHGGRWFGGTPGFGPLYCEEMLDDLVGDLMIGFGGMWPSAQEIEKVIIEGRKELEIYAEDRVC